MGRKALWVYVASVLVGSTSTGSAQAVDVGPYVGGGIGYSLVDDDLGGANVDDNAVGWKLFGGSRFSENWGVEAAWVSLGEMEEVGASVDPTGLSLLGVGYLPMNGWDAYGKLGFWVWDSDPTIVGNPSVDDSGTDLVAGVGARYGLNDALAVTGEWEMYWADPDASMISINAEYTFPGM